MSIRKESRTITPERVSLLIYTYISYLSLLEICFRSDSYVASLQVRPETCACLHVKCLLQCPILTKIRECVHNSVELTNAKFNENPSSRSRVVTCGYADRHSQSNVCIFCEPFKVEVLIFFSVWNLVLGDPSPCIIVPSFINNQETSCILHSCCVRCCHFWPML
jgi:hypothetical protein